MQQWGAKAPDPANRKEVDAVLVDLLEEDLGEGIEDNADIGN